LSFAALHTRLALACIRLATRHTLMLRSKVRCGSQQTAGATASGSAPPAAASQIALDHRGCIADAHRRAANQACGWGCYGGALADAQWLPRAEPFRRLPYPEHLRLPSRSTSACCEHFRAPHKPASPHATPGLSPSAQWPSAGAVRRPRPVYPAHAHCQPDSRPALLYAVPDRLGGYPWVHCSIYPLITLLRTAFVC
jgi:hypothetical protein